MFRNEVVPEQACEGQEFLEYQSVWDYSALEIQGGTPKPLGVVRVATANKSYVRIDTVFMFTSDQRQELTSV